MEAKKRGRPREFDVEQALDRATEAFLRHGYSGCSLEQLADAMRLNKPSLYAAFGNKRALYMVVVQRITDARGERYRRAFARGDSLQDALRALFEEVVEVTTSDALPPGCLVASSATTEAIDDPAIADYTREFFALSDKSLAAGVRARASRDGALSPEAIGRLANGVIHDLSLRARIGESRTKLRQIAREAAAALAHAAGAAPAK